MEAIRKVFQYEKAYLANERIGNEGMLQAANIAGRAINITQTTAGHAMCYKLTTLYGLAHGHAAAFCVEALWPYMAAHTEECIDPRGEAYLQEMFQELAQVMGCTSVEGSIKTYKALLKELALPAPVMKTKDELVLLKSSVNPDRLKNNPVLLKDETLEVRHHMIGANEGNCTALAAGYHLATGKVPVVYLQNSGEGNIINPAASLLNDKVYAIPVIFVVGWRGEPGVHDEPQHIYQGQVTVRLLEDMDIKTCIIGKETTEEELKTVMAGFRNVLAEGKSVAFVIRKGALTYEEEAEYTNANTMVREEILRHIVQVSGTDPIVSTTGKASRELFEIREANGQGHQYDFLTVGSMGHSSSIALGIAAQKPEQKVWCVDGDGAVLMHMGSMAVLGASHLDNLIHVVINNGAHETVGGMPTAAESIDLTGVARACGYPYAVCVDNYEMLDQELGMAKERKALSFIEIKCSIGSRADLGRPTTTARQNKERFMDFLSGDFI